MNLTEAVSDLIDTRIFEAQAYPGLYVTFMVLLNEQLPREDEAETRYVKADTSNFPGNGKAFSWLTDVRAEARQAETVLCDRLGRHPLGPSGTDVTTIRILRRLPDLALNVHDADSRPRSSHQGDGTEFAGCGCLGHDVERAVARLVVRAQEILGESEPWSRYVKDDGTEEPCWVCGNKSLRVRRAARVLRCVFPGCSSEWDTDQLEYVVHTDGAA
jgi:hypothetical protein